MTRILTSDVLSLTSLGEVVVAKSVSQLISPLTSLILALRGVVEAKVGVLFSIYLILLLESVFF